MTETEIADAVILLGFILGLLLTVTRLTVRLAHYSVSKHAWPKLAKRDIIAFGGLLLPFLLIFAVRVLDLAPALAGQLWWRLVTGIPALIAVWTLAYYELFIIEANGEAPSAD